MIAHKINIYSIYLFSAFIYLLSLRIIIHLNECVLPGNGNKLVSVLPLVLCLVMELLCKVLGCSINGGEWPLHCVQARFTNSTPTIPNIVATTPAEGRTT